MSKQVNDVVNTQILMRSGSAGQWRFPLTVRKKLNDVKMTNPVAKKFCENFNSLVIVCTEDYPHQITKRWIDFTERYLRVSKLLESRRKFTDEHICKFQLEADELFEVYYSLTGRDGLTHYWHCL